MLVYLDTSQISQISDLEYSSSHNNDFFNVWNQNNLQLCLSLQHLMEISNLEDKQSRERRLNCLKKIEKVNFSPFGWSSIIKYEVIIQMIRIINSRKNELIQLKENIWKKIDPNSLLDYIEGNLDKLQTPRKLYEAASEIEEIFKPVRKKLGRSFDTKKIVDLDSIGKNDLEDAKNIIEHLRSVNKTDSASDMFFKKIYKSVKLTD